MKQELIIVGAGGLGREVLWQIQENKTEYIKYTLLGFVDDAPELIHKKVNGYPVLGNIEWLKNYQKQVSVVIAIGCSKTRKKIAIQLEKNSNLRFPSIFSSGVKMSEWVTYGKGCIFCLNSIATVNIQIGDYFISNWNCTVGHDCVIGDFVTLYPNVNISGNVSIGDETEIGTGVQIIQEHQIGSQCIIGAGSVVIRDIPDKSLAVGVPTRIVEKDINNL
ncbi:MAG: acetyltransferase [Lachnospiraceae bacterium]|jgi:sugar O-acyltransferase (sialic acid O-acetyltransferase NeuD family)|nr:acetyltransferase [Lachnospiraceae bacterium]MCX4315553.1 acetyltransferase [Lachnospiraceae bacterium]